MRDLQDEISRVPLRMTAFATDGIAPEKRHAAWRGQPAPTSVQLFDTVPEPGFTAQSETYELGPLRLSFGTYGAQHVTRSAARIRADGIDDMGICLCLSGELRIGDPAKIAGEGSVYLCDLSREWEHYSTDCEVITLILSRELAIANGLEPELLHGTIIASDHTGMLRHHLKQIREWAPQLSADDGPRLSRTIIDLIAVSLGIAGRLAQPLPASANHALKMRAEALIAKRIEDPELSTAMLCRKLGISRATIYRLFAEDGGVQTRIRQTRLHAARAALQDPAVRIGKVAERFGFGEPAYFSRIFRAEFGVTPSAYRAIFQQGLGDTKV